MDLSWSGQYAVISGVMLSFVGAAWWAGGMFDRPTDPASVDESEPPRAVGRCVVPRDHILDPHVHGYPIRRRAGRVYGSVHWYGLAGYHAFAEHPPPRQPVSQEDIVTAELPPTAATSDASKVRRHRATLRIRFANWWNEAADEIRGWWESARADQTVPWQPGELLGGKHRQDPSDHAAHGGSDKSRHLSPRVRPALPDPYGPRCVP